MLSLYFFSGATRVRVKMKRLLLLFLAVTIVSGFAHDRYDTTQRDPARITEESAAANAPPQQNKKPPPPGLGQPRPAKPGHTTESEEGETESSTMTTDKPMDEKATAEKLTKKIEQTFKAVKQVAKKIDKAASLQKDMERLQSEMKKKKVEPVDEDDEEEKKPDDTFDQLNSKFAKFLDAVSSLATDSKLPEVAEFIRAETKHLMWLDTAGHAIEEVIPHLGKMKTSAEEAETWRAKIPESETEAKKLSRLENVIDMADIKVTDLKSSMDTATKYYSYYKEFYITSKKKKQEKDE